MQPLDLVRAGSWERSLFTTYALSLSFFEAVMMDGFVRGGGKSPVILCDIEGVGHALSEMGARLVGREYELIPVYQQNGVFHPKISLFQKEDDAHLLVGTGNLTFGGWGGNAELLEHFHVGNEPQVLEDVAEFLELLLLADEIAIPRASQIEAHIADLRQKLVGKTGSGRIRLLHNLGQTVAERIVEEAEALGGAERICFKSPFYDVTGTGVKKLSAQLGCAEIFGYVHTPGEVMGTRSANWPHSSTGKLGAVGTDQPLSRDGRRLHAKSFEVICRRGRLVVTGSANATHAGLYGPNSEASVLRIFSDRQDAWVLSDAIKPAQHSQEQDDAEGAASVIQKIVAAQLKGQSIDGEILGGWAHTTAELTCEVSGETLPLGKIDITPEGTFTCQNELLAEQAWKAGRVVVELRAEDQLARGFLSIKAVVELARRVGAAGTRILAILSGTDTPEDVAAIVSWFHEDLERIPRASATHSNTENSQAEKSQFVPAAAFNVNAVTGPSPSGWGSGQAGMDYAMRALLDSFRSSRGPFDEEAQAAKERGELSNEEEEKLVRSERQNERTLVTFESLLRVALAHENNGVHCETMLSLAHYLTDRLRPTVDQATDWFNRIRRAVPSHCSEGLGADLIAVELALFAASPSPENAVKSRRFLERTNLLAALNSANVERLPALSNTLPEQLSRDAALESIASSRTAGEELDLLLSTPPDNLLPSLPTLEKHPRWDLIRQLHSDPSEKLSLETVNEPERACPNCSLVLATSAYQDLLTFQIAKCTNRCGSLIAVRDESE